jgi:hypothetical protein
LEGGDESGGSGADCTVARRGTGQVRGAGLWGCFAHRAPPSAPRAHAGPHAAPHPPPSHHHSMPPTPPQGRTFAALGIDYKGSVMTLVGRAGARRGPVSPCHQGEGGMRSSRSPDRRTTAGRGEARRPPKPRPLRLRERPGPARPRPKPPPRLHTCRPLPLPRTCATALASTATAFASERALGSGGSWGGTRPRGGSLRATLAAPPGPPRHVPRSLVPQAAPASRQQCKPSGCYRLH